MHFCSTAGSLRDPCRIRPVIDGVDSHGLADLDASEVLLVDAELHPDVGQVRDDEDLPLTIDGLASSEVSRDDDPVDERPELVRCQALAALDGREHVAASHEVARRFSDFANDPAEAWYDVRQAVAVRLDGTQELDPGIDSTWRGGSDHDAEGSAFLGGNADLLGLVLSTFF